MTATYDGLEFKTRLEATWAAFFDLAGWRWQTNPVAVGDWKPDFRVAFECTHSECGGGHTIFVSVLPVSHIDEVRKHPALTHCYSVKNASGRSIAEAGAIFGLNPLVTQWEMSHGAGGGMFDVEFWVDNAKVLWEEAKAKVSAGS